MKAGVRILLLVLGVVIAPAWGDPPDPQTLLAKLPSPPKDYAAAKTRCANPQEKGSYLSRDPGNAALAEDIKKQVKDFEGQLSKDAKANMAQNVAAAQAAAMDPRQMMAVAQMQQASMGSQLPPDPATLADQLFQPPLSSTLSALQANEQDQMKSGQGWESKYSACASLPLGASACQKTVQGKAQAEAADIGKKRTPMMEKYYTDLDRNWSQYRDGVQKYLDAVKLTLPAGVDPNGYQVKIMLNMSQDRRMQAVETAAEKSGEAICPGFLYEAEQQYGGICSGEGC